MANSIRQHPELSLPSTDNVTDLVVHLKRSFTQEQSTLLTMIEEDLKSTGHCRLYLTSKDGWMAARNSFALQKFSPIIPLFNREYVKRLHTYFCVILYINIFPESTGCVKLAY